MRRPSASSRCRTTNSTPSWRQRFGLHLGEIGSIGPRRAYPLGLFIARSFVAERLALIGDAAHVIHPIAGQGLNMGLRDVAALAEAIVDAARLGLDIGGAGRAGALPALAPLRHHDDGRRDRRVQPAVLQPVRHAARWCATSASGWSTACRRSSVCSSARPRVSPANCRSCFAGRRCDCCPGREKREPGTHTPQ